MPLAVSQYEPPANFARNDLGKSGLRRRSAGPSAIGTAQSHLFAMRRDKPAERRRLKRSKSRRVECLTAVVLDRTSLGNYSGSARRLRACRLRGSPRRPLDVIFHWSPDPEMRRRYLPATIVMSDSPNSSRTLWAPRRLSALDPDRPLDPPPRASFAPWLAVVLVVVLFSLMPGVVEANRRQPARSAASNLSFRHPRGHASTGIPANADAPCQVP